MSVKPDYKYGKFSSYGPWAHKEFGEKGERLPTKTCKECGTQVTSKECIRSCRPGHLFHDALTWEAAQEFAAAAIDSEKQEALDKKILEMPIGEYRQYAKLQSYFICLECELNFRVEEWKTASESEKEEKGEDWPTAGGVRKDAARDRKGKAHEERGRMHAAAVQKINEMYHGPDGVGISQKRRKAMIDEETNRLGQLLAAKITRGGLFLAFTTGAQRLIKDQDLYDKMIAAYNVYINDPENNEKYEAYSALEDEVDKSVQYTACGGDPRKLFLVDYCSQLDEDGEFRIFDMCRAKIGQEGTCGIYMPPNLWKKDPVKHRWYCKPDYAFACETDVGIKRKLNKIYGDDLDDIENKMAKRMKSPCCGARYFPWARGESQVVEVDLDDGNGKPETYCFIADRIPKQLDDEIKKFQAEFVRAQWQLTDKEIIGLLPKVYPCDKYLVNGDVMPCIGRFPVDTWIGDQRPVLDAAGWCALSQCIAKKDLKNLGGIFDLGKSLESMIRADEKRMEQRQASSSSTALAVPMSVDPP